MFQLHRKGCKQSRTDTATPATFCKILKEEVEPLYLLGFLLTASHQNAEECFLATVDEPFEHLTVFADWAQAWIKHCLVKHAVRHVFRAPTSASRDSWSQEPGSAQASAIDRIAQLPALERFAFVLTTLEGYSTRKCAALLNHGTEEIVRAKINALRQLSFHLPPPNQELEAPSGLRASPYDGLQSWPIEVPLHLPALSRNSPIAS